MLAAGETAAFPCGISLPQPGMDVGAARHAVTYQACRGHGARTMQGQPLLLAGNEGSNEWPKCPRRDQGRCLGFPK